MILLVKEIVQSTNGKKEKLELVKIATLIVKTVDQEMNSIAQYVKMDFTLTLTSVVKILVLMNIGLMMILRLVEDVIKVVELVLMKLMITVRIVSVNGSFSNFKLK